VWNEELDFGEGPWMDFNIQIWDVSWALFYSVFITIYELLPSFTFHHINLSCLMFAGDLLLTAKNQASNSSTAT
jgi:hypothetical protein